MKSFRNRTRRHIPWTGPKTKTAYLWDPGATLEIPDADVETGEFSILLRSGSLMLLPTTLPAVTESLPDAASATPSQAIAQVTKTTSSPRSRPSKRGKRDLKE